MTDEHAARARRVRVEFRDDYDQMTLDQVMMSKGAAVRPIGSAMLGGVTPKTGQLWLAPSLSVSPTKF